MAKATLTIPPLAMVLKDRKHSLAFLTLVFRLQVEPSNQAKSMRS